MGAVGSGKRALRPRPAEFETDLDAGMKQPEMRLKYKAGDESIHRWKDEIYLARAEKVLRRK